jgi:DnaJ-domain-containing protein 1
MLSGMNGKTDNEAKARLHRLVGAGIGWFVAGPVGAALGLWVGHSVRKKSDSAEYKAENGCLKRHYDVLKVPYNAGLDEIKGAYKRQAQKYHPDRFGENTDPVLEELARERMCQINEAYGRIVAALEEKGQVDET